MPKRRYTRRRVAESDAEGAEQNQTPFKSTIDADESDSEKAEFLQDPSSSSSRRVTKRKKSQGDKDASKDDAKPRVGQTLVSAEEDKKPEVDSISPFSKLTGDLIIKIFSFLEVKPRCRCALVCKQWGTYSKDKTLWDGAILEILADYHDWEIFRRFSPAAAFSAMLSSGYIHASQVYFHADVSMLIPGFLEALKNLPKGCKMPLERVTFHGSQAHVTDNGLRILKEHCESVQYVYASECTEISDWAMADFLSGCQNLEELFLADTLVNQMQVTAFAVAKFCPKLRKLTVSTCDIPSLLYIVQHCKDLQGLKVYISGKVDPDSISRLAKKFTSLHDLQVSFSGDCLLQNAQLIELAGKLTGLGLICVDTITRAGLEVFLSRSPALQHLDLDLQCLDTESVYFIAQVCRNLRSLKIASSRRGSQGTTLDGAFLRLLGTTNRNLRKLALPHSTGPTDADLIALAQQCPLEELDLEGCRWVTDASLTGLVPNSAKLDFLSLSKCDKISDRGLLELLGSCPSLWEVRICDAPKLSDAVLRFLENNADSKLIFPDFTPGQFSEAAVMRAAVAKQDCAILKHKFLALTP